MSNNKEYHKCSKCENPISSVEINHELLAKIHDYLSENLPEKKFICLVWDKDNSVFTTHKSVNNDKMEFIGQLELTKSTLFDDWKINGL